MFQDVGRQVRCEISSFMYPDIESAVALGRGIREIPLNKMQASPSRGIACKFGGHRGVPCPVQEHCTGECLLLGEQVES